jgi:hypothetical protein
MQEMSSLHSLSTPCFSFSASLLFLRAEAVVPILLPSSSHRGSLQVPVEVLLIGREAEKSASVEKYSHLRLSLPAPLRSEHRSLEKLQ